MKQKGYDPEKHIGIPRNQSLARINIIVDVCDNFELAVICASYIHKCTLNNWMGYAKALGKLCY